LAGIKNDNAINPGRGEPPGVHVETEPFGPTKPGLEGPKAETGAKVDGAYVEFDLPPNAQKTNIGPRNTAVVPTDKPLPLDGLNPKFVETRPWWKFW
jgi:hypothetical protein